jgi:hypothetical protein
MSSFLNNPNTMQILEKNLDKVEWFLSENLEQNLDKKQCTHNTLYLKSRNYKIYFNETGLSMPGYKTTDIDDFIKHLHISKSRGEKLKEIYNNKSEWTSKNLSTI